MSNERIMGGFVLLNMVYQTLESFSQEYEDLPHTRGLSKHFGNYRLANSRSIRAGIRNSKKIDRS